MEASYESLPCQGAETERISPPEEAAVKTVTVDGYPAGPTAVAWPAQKACTRLQKIFAAAASCQKICVLALRGFTTVTSMISFIIAATVAFGRASRGFLIATMVILCAGNIAYLVAIGLQMLGVQIKAKMKLVCGMRKFPLNILICGVLARLELIVLLLAFGASISFATDIDGCPGYYSDCGPKSKAAVAMGFLASISQLATVFASGWTMKCPNSDLKSIQPESIKLDPDYV